jgi:hypothetical protein
MKDMPSLVSGADTSSVADARGTLRATISRHGAPPSCGKRSAMKGRRSSTL